MTKDTNPVELQDTELETAVGGLIPDTDDSIISRPRHQGAKESMGVLLGDRGNDS